MAEDAESSQKARETDSAMKYLTSLLNKTLRIQIGDGRLFVGQMKCTDKDCNIILQNAQEYRETSSLANNLASSISSQNKASLSTDVSNRYVGLIVVPGEHIKKIEIEEFDPALIA